MSLGVPVPCLTLTRSERSSSPTAFLPHPWLDMQVGAVSDPCLPAHEPHSLHVAGFPNVPSSHKEMTDVPLGFECRVVVCIPFLN